MKPQLKNLIDIHSHILPGLDDGPRNLEQSLSLARCYQESGVSTVVATPHYLPGTAWSKPKEDILKKTEQLQEQLFINKINLNILPGMEIGFHRNLVRNLHENKFLPIGNNDHYLIEPTFHGEQHDLIAVLTQLLEEGTRIILAHPERVRDFQSEPELLGVLIKRGTLIQVNSGSLLGYFGNRAKNMAGMLQERGWIHFLASDAHNHDRRPPISTDEWQALLNKPNGLMLLRKCISNTNIILNAN